MKMFESWSFELTKLIVTHPNAIFSLREVAVHFNVLSLLMEDWVRCNM